MNYFFLNFVVKLRMLLSLLCVLAAIITYIYQIETTGRSLLLVDQY